ncbi:MAG: hypothetical protein LRY67_06335 [Gammaproteobacteria bacterium]|nr:hypothetical protein [Gammaproteobacteria bacterium]MCD8542036.1 hypothetical protein [Gammaproteobacteria bacterium]
MSFFKPVPTSTLDHVERCLDDLSRVTAAFASNPSLDEPSKGYILALSMAISVCQENVNSSPVFLSPSLR